MKPPIHLILLYTLILSVLQCKKQKQQAQSPSPNKNKTPQIKTTLTYHIKQSNEDENDAIKLTLQLTDNDPSLLDAVDKANQLKEQVKEIYIDFCVKYDKDVDQHQCQRHIDISDYQIQAEYYHLRGQELFKTNVIKFQMVFIVTAFQKIGVLIDQYQQLMYQNLVILKSIIWQDIDQQNKQYHIMEKGLEKAKDACKNLDMRFKNIKQITIVQQQEQQVIKKKSKVSQDQQEQEQQQEEQQEQENDKGDGEERNKYKFVAVCKSKQIKEKVKISKKNFKTLVKQKEQNIKKKKNKSKIQQQ